MTTINTSGLAEISDAGIAGLFGRMVDADTVAVFTSDGDTVTRLHVDVYPVGSSLSARYEHPAGITLSLADADRIGLVIER